MEIAKFLLLFWGICAIAIGMNAEDVIPKGAFILVGGAMIRVYLYLS